MYTLYNTKPLLFLNNNNISQSHPDKSAKMSFVE